MKLRPNCSYSISKKKVYFLMCVSWPQELLLGEQLEFADHR